MTAVRRVEDAQHEAAHVVVGLALGLRLREARLLPQPDPGGDVGYVWFPAGSDTALVVMYAAGVAWEDLVGGPAWTAREDLAEVRRLTRSAAGARAAVRCARALLETLAGPHARVTRALLERDLTGRDAAALIRGDWRGVTT